MRIDKVVASIKTAQSRVKDGLVETPPQSMEDYKKQLGFWQGITEALRIIEEAKEEDDD